MLSYDPIEHVYHVVDRLEFVLNLQLCKRKAKLMQGLSRSTHIRFYTGKSLNYSINKGSEKRSQN